MGWRDRDWARLRDDELQALYGVDRAARRTAQTAPEPAATRTRLLVWPLVAAACVAVGAIAYAERTGQATSPVLATAWQRGVLYGTPATLHGTQTACTRIRTSAAGSA